MDVCGRPPAVLKTAWLTSTDVHRQLLEFDLGRRNSVAIHDRPQSCAMLAVILAVMAAPVTTHFSLI